MKKKYIIVFLSTVSTISESCSIIGYIGNQYCKNFVIQGLANLEYRGYDSAGFACIKDGEILITKAAGKLDNLIAKLVVGNNGYVGIGHTRWATHGQANEQNAHPHFNETKSIALVHNGIIENHFELKEKFKNHKFSSETDTEVIVHLLEENLQNQNLEQAILKTINQLEGSFALAIIFKDYPDILIGVRYKSPLCIGLGKDENYLASDCLAFAEKTNKAIFLPDRSWTIITKESVSIFDFAGNKIAVPVTEVNIEKSSYTQMGYEHFMLKEINEQPEAISNCVKWYSENQNNIAKILGLDLKKLENISSIHLIGCGSSWHAGLIGQFFFEEICQIPTQVHLASEFRYKRFFPDKNALYIGISQSGETADTLEALRLIKEHNLQTLGITNVLSSSISRECDGFLPTLAGPEIAVASTKTFTTQVAAMYWLANYINYQKKLITISELQQANKDLNNAGKVINQTIDRYSKEISELAHKFSNARIILFLGRHLTYPFAMEAALKLKEISYMCASGYSAGELKHGSIALIDQHTPVVIFSSPDQLIYQKLLSNAQEIKARKGILVAFAFEGQKQLIEIADYKFIFPQTTAHLAPIMMSGAMQLISYYFAKERGCEIDKPRNLAKSVTVE